MVEYYVREAVKINATASAELFSNLEGLENTALAYATFDYNLFRQFTFIANKPVYGLILNSFKEMYIQVASLFFREEIARQGTLNFYQTLKMLCEQGDDEAVQQCMRKIANKVVYIGLRFYKIYLKILENRSYFERNYFYSFAY